MHDFMLAKEIIDSVLEIIKDKKLDKIKSVSLEIGNVVLAHDGFPEHAEEISLENLKFGLKGIAKNTILKDATFEIKKTDGSDWKITNIEV
jgi:Zn finger protein HypA/HybF involved in hydrogenase expression